MKIKKEHFLLFLIIFLATFLRFYNIAYTEFKADQALNLYLGIDLIKNNFITDKILSSSVGLYNPPFFHYLLSLPLILSKNPIFASSFISLLNTLAILICYLLLKKISSFKTALLGTLFYAVNPWVILYSRHIWHQNALPFFVLIFIYGLVSLIKNKNGAYLILATAGLSFALQLHQSTLPLTLLLIFVIFWQKKNIKFIHLLLSLFGFLLIFTPYFIFEITHNYYNLKQYLKLSHLPWQFHSDALLIPWQLSTTLKFENYLGGKLPFVLTHPLPLLALDILYLALLATAFIWLILNFKKRQEFLIFILWFWLPVIFLLFNKTSVYRHYFIVLFPVQFIILALFISNFLKKKRGHKCLPVILSCCIFLLAAYQFLYSFSYLNLIKQKKCFTAEYGPTLKYQMEEVDKNLKAGESNFSKILQQSCQCSPYCYPHAIKYLIDYFKHSL